MFLNIYDENAKRARGARRLPRARTLHQRGSTSVEMVFILPVALLLVFAIADFGLAFGRYQLLINAAHEGARVASLHLAPCDAAAVRTAAEETTQAAFQGLGLSSGDADVSVTGQCGPLRSEVTVAYQHDFPIITAFSSLPASLPLEYTAVRANQTPNPGGSH